MVCNVSSNDFAYVLGVICGDGHCRVRKSGGEIQLKVKDKDFTERFKKSLDLVSGRECRLFKKYGFYHAYLASTECAKNVLSFDIESIAELNSDFQIAFLRGMFDSEGGVIVHNLEKRQKAKRWIHFSNNVVKIIQIIKNILDQNKLKYSVVSRVHSGFGSKKLQYEIILYGVNNLIWFAENKIFSINRKRILIEKAICSYEQKNIDKALMKFKEVDLNGRSNCLRYKHMSVV